jgi:hypothetical protein
VGFVALDSDPFKGSKHIDGVSIKSFQKSGGMCMTLLVERAIAASGPPSAFSSTYNGVGNIHMVASM